MEPNPLDATHPQEREAVVVLEIPELSLYGGAAAVEERQANLAKARSLPHERLAVSDGLQAASGSGGKRAGVLGSRSKHASQLHV